MQQRRWEHEVEKGQAGIIQQGRSLVLITSQRSTEMRERDIAHISRKHPPLVRYLLSIPFAKLALFMRRVLSVLVSGFILTILNARREAARRRQVQQHTLALQQATELEDQFISMASHELKTPMTTISGHTQLLMRRLSRLPELSGELAAIGTALERIDGQTRRLNTLVNDLLDLNRIRSGKMALRLRLCNLIDICREVVEDQHFLTGRNIRLDAPPVPLMLQADSDRLSQVVVNLVSNALKYSAEENPVKVRVGQYGNSALIQVCDAGAGIPKDQQAHIFEPFYRAPDVQASLKSGLGLGLAICKEIVERHSGRIWYDSQVDKGSIFFVELPMHK